jgi:Glycosyltransferase Maf N-terminal domain/6-hydroxymethylpterin diphosphokinase MptE-like
MTKKAKARSHREKRNRQAFAERFPAVLRRIDSAEQRSTSLVRDEGVPVNVELGGALLYPNAAAEYVRAQLQAFKADPDRLGFTDPSHCNLSPISLKLLDDLVRYMRERELPTRLAGYPVADVGYLFVFGVGLGDHLEALLNETPARHIVLIEPFAEFLLHSLAVADWRKLFAIAERRRISFHFILAQEPEAICCEIEQLISLNGNVFLDGSYFFQHYYCWIFRESILMLKERLKVYFNTSGFFEDEIEMIRNCHGNLRRWDLRVVEPKRCREQNFPVIIAGAGPSLDRDLPRLRQLRDRAIVVSCGTAIGVLLKNGIRPDLHCEIERGELVHTLLSQVRDTYGFEGITLVASTTVDPRVPSLFEKTWCFVRAGLSPAVILTDGIPALPFVDPLCCNAAFATVAALGFRNIWLFGLDLAQKEEGRHHAKDSVYYEPSNAAIDEDYRRRFNRVVAGNFGGTVRTFWAFDSGRYMLGKAQRHFRTNLVNCSDGASIDGARAKVATAVALPAVPTGRDAVLAHVESGLRAVAGEELLTALDLQPHIQGCEDYLQVLDEVLQAWLHTDDGFFDLEERLVAAVRDKLDAFRGFHSMSRGSVIAMLRLGAFFGSRIADRPEYMAYREHFVVCYRTHCAAIAAKVRDLLSSLEKDIGAPLEPASRAA